MYFAVVKLTFESQGKSAIDRKEVRSLVEKLRARFKVCASVCEEDESQGATSIAVATLGSTEERLTQSLDAISEFCESHGIGRIESEQTLMDHIDSIQEFNAGDESE